MNRIAWILFLTAILFSCKEEGDQNKEGSESSYIIFGQFYGFCQGETCVENYRLTDTKLYEETTDPYVLKPGTGTFVELDHSKFELVKSLTTKIPQQLLDTTEEFIGSPDAADGGGIYFETTVNGKPKFWRIDKVRTNLPSYLIPFVEEIEKNIKLLEN